jgi:hypothetical protein
MHMAVSDELHKLRSAILTRHSETQNVISRELLKGFVEYRATRRDVVQDKIRGDKILGEQCNLTEREVEGIIIDRQRDARLWRDDQAQSQGAM